MKSEILACKRPFVAYEVMGRKCSMHDVNTPRQDIIIHDLVKQGLPKEAENADLIFWNPPYYKKKKEVHSPF
jgi:tRNA1(Val) A37 N6-methylase TrmN6